jgi:iron complex transport system permease protein
MKVTLDLSRLVEDGKLTPAEAEKLKALASQDTGSFAINILIGFAVVSIAAGAVALVPTPMTAVLLGVALFAAGCGIVLNRVQQWSVFGQICLVIGALMFAGGVIAWGEGSLASMLIVTVVLALAAIAAHSSLLIALAVLAASACLGARTGYSHASYSLAIFEPALTIVLFSALAFVAYNLSHRLSADYERLALMASRTSVVLVNFGFWIGSLWGDPLMLLRGMSSRNAYSYFINDTVIPDWVFSIAWAVVLVAAGAWAAKANRRWLVNVAAAFGAIHFYTQWFERLGATPASVLLGGLVMLGIAFALWSFNRRPEPSTPAQA